MSDDCSHLGHFALIRSHGGAGATTLAALLDPSGQGTAIEVTAGQRIPEGYLPVVLARSTATGIEQAARMLVRWSAKLPLPALVVVADSPLPTPKSVAFKVEGISGRVRTVVNLPYLFDLRELADPVSALDNSRAASAVDTVRAALVASMHPVEVSA